MSDDWLRQGRHGFGLPIHAVPLTRRGRSLGRHTHYAQLGFIGGDDRKAMALAMN